MKTHIAAACALTLLVGGFALVATAQQPKNEAKPARQELAGAYTIVSGERDGKPVPEERLKGCQVVFTADKIVGTDKDKKEFFAATYILDTTHTPWLIKMKSTSPKEAEALGLVKADADTVTIIYALPGADAPLEFKTKEKQHLFVLKKVANKRDDP